MPSAHSSAHRSGHQAVLKYRQNAHSHGHSEASEVLVDKALTANVLLRSEPECSP